jgi:hypothetical protein
MSFAPSSRSRRSRGVPIGALSLFAVAVPALAAAQNQNNNPPPAPPAAAAPAAAAGAPASAAAPAPEQPPPGFLKEPSFIGHGINFAVDKLGDGSGEKESGFYPEFSNMLTGSGWLSVGPGYRKYLFDKKAFVDVSGAVSWRFYKMMQGTFEYPSLLNDRITVGVQTMWQDETQVNYFGAGPNSLEDNQSQYRIQTPDIVGYVTARPKKWLSISQNFGFLYRPAVMNPGGTFKRDFPSTLDQFPNQPGVGLIEQPSFLHNEFSVQADTRDHRSHPTSGGLYRAAVTSYLDQDDDIFSFNQYEAEAVQMLPILDDSKWVAAIRAWALITDVPSGHEIPFYLQPSLGGQNTLRSYHNFRFHDRHLLNVNAESRWALYSHVDGAVFFDAGSVAARARDLTLDTTSYGAGVRLHTQKTTFARFDAAYGREGWRFLFRTSDPLKLSRVVRRIADVPFAP